MTATICYFDSPPKNEFFVFFKGTLLPILVRYGAPCLATFVTESSPNNYPRLAVREGEYVFVWFSLFTNGTSYENHIRALEESSDWLKIQVQLKEFLIKPVEYLEAFTDSAFKANLTLMLLVNTCANPVPRMIFTFHLSKIL